MLALGLLIEALLHHHGFRKLCLEAFWAAGQSLRHTFVVLPRQLLQLPLVRAMLASPYFGLVKQYLIKPAIVSLLLAAAFRFSSIAAPRSSRASESSLPSTCCSTRALVAMSTNWLPIGWCNAGTGCGFTCSAALFRFIVEVFPADFGNDRAAALHGRRVAALQGRREQLATTLAKAVLDAASGAWSTT